MSCLNRLTATKYAVDNLFAWLTASQQCLHLLRISHADSVARVSSICRKWSLLLVEWATARRTWVQMGYTEKEEVGRVKLKRLVSQRRSEPEILKSILWAKSDVGHSLLNLTLSFPDESSDAGTNYMPKNLITLHLNSRNRIPKNASSTPHPARLETTSSNHRNWPYSTAIFVHLRFYISIFSLSLFIYVWV